MSHTSLAKCNELNNLSCSLFDVCYFFERTLLTKPSSSPFSALSLFVFTLCTMSVFEEDSREVSQEVSASAESIPSKDSTQAVAVKPTPHSPPSTKSKISGAFRSMALKLQMFAASPKVLVISGLVLSLCLIAEGLLCFSKCSPNVRSYILSIYYIVFGLLSICMELQFKFIGTYCNVLLSFSGKGIWYLFLATLSFGSEWWAVLVGILLLGNGMMNSFVGCSPIMIKEEKKVITDEEVELKVELGKLEDMEELDAMRDPGYRSNQENHVDGQNGHSVAEC